MGSSARTGIGLVDILRRQLDPASDPRVGSARDNSTSVSPLRVTSGTNSASLSTLFSTFVPVAIYSAICVLIFLTLRRKYPRVYAPRSFLSTLEPHERSPRLPSGWFNWILPFYRIPDTYILDHCSLDGYLFLRYLKVLIVICIVGVLLSWPLLLPLHVYGGGGDIQLDLLAFGNVDHIAYYYAHALLAWIFFGETSVAVENIANQAGFVLYMVSRECVYFINLRQAYLLSPYYANRLSSRTVLFTCAPQQILEERKIRRIFGDTVKNVWIPREIEGLDNLIKEREQTARRLERAEIQLIRKANVAYRKAAKNGQPNIEVKRESASTTKSDPSKVVEVTIPEAPKTPASPREFARADGVPIVNITYGSQGPPPDINGSVAAQWIPAEARPYHRPLANYGRRVDTIKWTRNRLKELAPKISKMRRQIKKGLGDPIPAVFVEFHSQVDAQSAYQSLAHHRANHMRPEIIGIRPQEIVWSSLRMSWVELIIRKFAIKAAIAVLIIFWSIPCAIIGIISNVKFLTTKVLFLKWIDLLPSPVLGLISGLLPALALSWLMSLVPAIMRACARQSGVPTDSRIELFVQNSYFVFQIVQVFLITTLTSAASAAITKIIQEPLSARALLAANLPKASNFYVSYFILQGLAMSTSRIVHAASYVRFQIMANTPGNPRVISARYHRLRRIHWGSIYPVFTNMGVIAICYSLIAPIILFPAIIGFAIIYLSYRYNLLYVYSTPNHNPSFVTPDTRGLLYPRALKQTLTGVYLAEICLVGLFGLRSAFIPVVLMFGLLIFTFLVHISLNDALSPLLYNLPRTLAAEEELRKAGNAPLDAEVLADKNDTADTNLDIEGAETTALGYDSDFDPGDPNAVSHGDQTTRGLSIPMEGADRAIDLTTNTVTSRLRAKYENSTIARLLERLDFWTYWISPNPDVAESNFVLRWLHPEVFSDYHVLRDRMVDATAGFPDVGKREEEEMEGEGGGKWVGNEMLKDAFHVEGVRRRKPRLWIPRDEAGVSRQEVEHCRKVVEITDEGAWMDEKGDLVSDERTKHVGEWVLRGEERVLW